ncbi:hypothetical protein D9756_008357 [Leucocoprinus leucothites]|uniref:Uncharacterized protein n=1 Tax=Leucocoprinus leucothites TaxID=201217 RepID=A0A8H5FW91_9AGAR|nr:hypothetical protein D9756_008357 [Leucoagaricus leucothites]
MTKFLSSNQLSKIDQWLTEVHTSPILLHPLHSIVQEIYHEVPPNIRVLQVPTYNFKRANEKRNYGKWKSEYLAKSSREQLSPDRQVIETCCQRLGLVEAFRPELNTVSSMSSLPHPEGNELVTESRSVLANEFVRVLRIRNSFYAEQQLYTGLLSCQRRLSPEVTIFYEMRQSECVYGCEKAQQAAQYVQAYAAAQRMDVDFNELLSALPYPEVVEERDALLTGSLSSSPGSTDVTGSTTMVSSAGKDSLSRKEIISEADFKNWKDRWVFQASHRPIRYPGTL